MGSCRRLVGGRGCGVVGIVLVASLGECGFVLEVGSYLWLVEGSRRVISVWRTGMVGGLAAEGRRLLLRIVRVLG